MQTPCFLLWGWSPPVGFATLTCAAIPLNYSHLVAKGSPEVVTNPNLRLDKTEIFGHIHPAVPKFRLEAVQEQPVCEMAVAITPEYALS